MAVSFRLTLWPVIVSAPFGNYVQPDGATPTLGTFTADPRPGRVRRVVRTVRYYRRLGAWVNNIGLRNPGIEWLARRVERGTERVDDKIVSIHGFDAAQWTTLLDHIERIRPLAVELNMSCPNVGEVNWPRELFENALATRTPVIVKLPPVNYQDLFHDAADAGVRAFHCCNTLPVPTGGLSGKPLKPLSLQCIRDIHERFAMGMEGEARIIGGGGITSPADIDDYVEAGVQRIALGTRVMNPLYLLTHRPLRPLIRHAHERLGAAPLGP